MAKVVSNTGPIIALANIGQLDLLRRLFNRIIIPPAVIDEVEDEISLAALQSASWIRIQSVNDRLAVGLLREELDAGESEAIILAGELSASLLLLDERAATRKARSIGLQTIGTLGVLLMAKTRKMISDVETPLDDLRRTGFYMSEALYHQILESANEL
jgi:uncharacterized protein